MAKRKQGKAKAQPPLWPIIKTTGVILAAVILIGGAGYVVVNFFRNASSFQVKKIVIPQELAFIEKGDLMRLQGENIFDVDLESFHEFLSRRYPQVADLRVQRQFPDRIRLDAQRRHAMAQMLHHDQYYLIDHEGYVLGKSSNVTGDFPVIRGLPLGPSGLGIGDDLDHNDLTVALNILEELQKDNDISRLGIYEVDVSNLSKIIARLTNGTEILLDWNDIAQKVEVLDFVISQKAFDFKQVKYIDLRFKEPIIGKR